ncbi:hypothetical protein [Kosakonia oryziphila]|uniref:hypothetical protein n=1 Tax=Kosakonia oryziphila TaxID=1005667 RepID=UPI001FC990D0|nr:hypothetical protein [Kosakonia oryziphila]
MYDNDFPDTANKEGLKMGKESSLYLMSLTIQDILQWIECNIAEPLSLGVLAQKSGYSAWHFRGRLSLSVFYSNFSLVDSF